MVAPGDQARLSMARAKQLDSFARAEVAAALGTDARVVRVTPLQDVGHAATLHVSVDRAPRQLVMKVADRDTAPAVDFARTAAVSQLARAAGAPVPEVLAAGTSSRASEWQYLLQEHVDGVEWSAVRTRLDEEQLAAAHRQIAAAVLAVQSVAFDGFGELSTNAEPAGVDLPAALRTRAGLRIADPRKRALFEAVLGRESAAFSTDVAPTLCHDDLHHRNVIFRSDGDQWALAGVLDWDKAWAGPAESDVARMAFWDDMTGPGFWEVYRAEVPEVTGNERRTLVYQLLWCLEYADDGPRHSYDTIAVGRRLGLEVDGQGNLVA
jgi:aminoglycoside phosphotransferase (APT) family kinase protein